MKIPAWSVFLLVPAILLVSAWPTIRKSESPGTLALIVSGASLLVSVVAWGILKVLDKSKSS